MKDKNSIMQRIPILLQKISSLANKTDASIIDIDLMLDYTKVVYADLLEMREKISLNESIKPATIQEEPEVVSQPIPEPQNVQEERTTIETEKPNVAETTPAENPVSENEIFQPVQQKTPKDIRSSIGINDKYQFISELFGNDKDQYNEVLDKINKMKSYEEAEKWLDESHQWNKDNMTVEMFYNTLNQFFSSM